MMIAASTASTVCSTTRPTTRPTPSKAVLAYRRKLFVASLKEATISGIPCLIEVGACSVVKGNCRADNPDDYYGYSECEFTVYDRKGYRAAWLDRKMSKDDQNAIEEMIASLYDGEDDGDPNYDRYDA